MNKNLLGIFSIMLAMLSMTRTETYAQLKNDYGNQGTIEIEVGEKKTIWLIDQVYDMLGYSTTKYPSGKWVLSNNAYNVSMISQDMKSCTIRGDKVGTGIKLTFSGDMILYNAAWAYTGYYMIKVVSKKTPVEKITLSPSSLSLEAGKEGRITATISPSNATDQNLTWSSSDNNVATVGGIATQSGVGLVIAKGSGTATITCKAVDGSGVTAECVVTVTRNLVGSRFKENTVEGHELEFEILDSYAKTCKVNKISDKTITGKLTIPATANGYKVTEIGRWSLYQCKMNSVSIPDGVETIGTAGLQQCENLTAISLPNSLRRLEDQSLKDCRSLETITGISNLEYIGNWAFENVPWLQKFPDGPIYIGKVLFAYKGDMPSDYVLSIKGGTTCIANTAVDWNPVTNTWGEGFRLVGIKIPASVKYIIGNPFSVSRLNSIIVDDANSVYDSRNNCNAVIETKTNTLIIASNSTEIPSTVKVIGGSAFSNKAITSLSIPDNVDSLGNAAIYNCSSLETILIGKGLRSMAHSGYSDDKDPKLNSNKAILQNHKLKSIVVASGNQYYDSRDNCNAIIEKSTNRLIVGCSSTLIPVSVTAICHEAFYGNGADNLYSFTIPDNIERIGANAFSYMTNLESIVLGKRVYQLGVSSWGSFSQCYKLRTIYSRIEFPTDIIEKAFNSTTYDEGTLFVPIGSSMNYRSTVGWSRFKNIEEFDADNFDSQILGIEGITADTHASGSSVFTLSGQRLSAPRKGLNIVGGRKVIVK